MGGLKLKGAAESIHRQHAHTVQTQKKKIHKVFMGQTVGRQMGVQKTQAAQAARSGPGARQFRNKNGIRVAYQHQFHPTLTIHDKADLARQQARQCGQFPRLLHAVASARTIAALSQTGQRLEFAGLEPGRAAFDPGGYSVASATDSSQVAIMSS